MQGIDSELIQLVHHCLTEQAPCILEASFCSEMELTPLCTQRHATMRVVGSQCAAQERGTALACGQRPFSRIGSQCTARERGTALACGQRPFSRVLLSVQEMASFGVYHGRAPRSTVGTCEKKERSLDGFTNLRGTQRRLVKILALQLVPVRR